MSTDNNEGSKISKNDFLLHMYDQMWGNINRHILTVWQSIAAVAGSLTIILFSDSKILSDTWNVSLILLLAFWLLAHVYDAQTWFDRNISIISKIENKFELTSQDISLLGLAYGLSPSSSRLALYRVYKDIDNKENFLLLKKLVIAIEKEEPFDTMPDEVKPSLSRILELTSNSESDTDRHILTPITNILTKYQ